MLACKPSFLALIVKNTYRLDCWPKVVVVVVLLLLLLLIIIITIIIIRAFFLRIRSVRDQHIYTGSSQTATDDNVTEITACQLLYLYHPLDPFSFLGVVFVYLDTGPCETWRRTHGIYVMLGCICCCRGQASSFLWAAYHMYTSLVLKQTNQWHIWEDKFLSCPDPPPL